MFFFKKPIIYMRTMVKSVLFYFFFLAIVVISAFSLASAKEIQYDTAGRRDPFMPLVGPDGVMSLKSKRTDFAIEGIIYDPSGGSMVIVNGEVLKAGDRIESANIIAIYRDRVILAQDDEEKTVWLREEIVEEGMPKNDKNI